MIPEIDVILTIEEVYPLKVSFPFASKGSKQAESIYTACVFVLYVSSQISVVARSRCSERDVGDEKSRDSLLENFKSSSSAIPALLTRR